MNTAHPTTLDDASLALFVGQSLDALTTALGLAITAGAAIEGNPLISSVAVGIAASVGSLGLPGWPLAAVAIALAKIVIASLAAIAVVAAGRYLTARVVSMWAYAVALVSALIATANVGVILI